MITHLLITGGCGFIGSNFIRYALAERPDWQLTNLDCMSYSANAENLADVADDARYRFVEGSICDAALVDRLVAGCDGVIHFAAESHVDRSIIDARPFIDSNVAGTQTLLDAVRRHDDPVRRMVHVSTDEVYGELPLEPTDARFREDTPIAPNSPYAASKAASDLLVRAAHRTFGLDVLITRCSNNFGPYQFPEKVVPLFVTNLIEDRKVPLYGDGLNVRDWIHVLDHCEAVAAVFERGARGAVYNIGADNERTNLELTQMILDAMGRGPEMIERVTDRPGHDRRYAIDSSRIQGELGWRPTRSQWPEALEDTVRWYVEHEQWWRRVKSGEYREYYERQYRGRGDHQGSASRG
ncbi:MAG: dTDP-glucose 4,6-dehydratase [Phycisphaeraceae bacterium]|nr:dTDP-glucose 4,6-dehydratase [Phycisphaeraceae bacterium]